MKVPKRRKFCQKDGVGKQSLSKLGDGEQKWIVDTQAWLRYTGCLILDNSANSTVN